MLKHITELLGYRVHARDGDIGNVSDFYFDDVDWTVRYLLVAARFEGAYRNVLIAPPLFQEPDWARRLFRINVPAEKVRNSPNPESSWPVPLRYESELAQYYRWPVYWTPDAEIPHAPEFRAPGMRTAVLEDEIATHQLLSVRDLTGYAVHAPDGPAGTVADFIFDDVVWRIPYLVIRLTGDRGEARLAPGWIREIADERRVLGIGILRANLVPQATYDFRDESRKGEILPRRHKWVKK